MPSSDSASIQIYQVSLTEQVHCNSNNNKHQDNGSENCD